MKTIYVDCTFLAAHNDLNTGIQRVVRRVIENFEVLVEQGQPYKIVPVKIGDGEFTPITIGDLYPAKVEGEPSKPAFRTRAIQYGKGVYRALRELGCAVIPSSKVRHFLFTHPENFGLNYLIYHGVVKPLKWLENAVRGRPQPVPCEAVNVGFDIINEGDVLLLIDTAWFSNTWPSIAKAKQKKANVIAVVYDLIPITHAQFCDAFHTEIFKEWVAESLKYVDKYIGISQTVQHDLMAYMEQEHSDSIADKGFDYFLLGGDFNYQTVSADSVRPWLVDHFKEGSNYLIVSTIEPRKNHQYLLDAFDKLWDQDEAVNLCVVGHVGWKVDALMERIHNHPKRNINLYIWQDLNDAELLYCYKQSKMLLFPSFVEGFGLPIVESLSNQLPVMASDTPIHREVGLDKIDYFSLDDPQSLSDKILDIEANGIPESLKIADDYRWMNWLESSQMLLEKIVKKEDKAAVVDEQKISA